MNKESYLIRLYKSTQHAKCWILPRAKGSFVKDEIWNCIFYLNTKKS